METREIVRELKPNEQAEQDAAIEKAKRDAQPVPPAHTPGPDDGTGTGNE